MKKNSDDKTEEELNFDRAATFRVSDMVRATLVVEEAEDLIKVYNHLS